MNENYHIELPKDQSQAIQFLEDRIYDHNSSVINKNDGRLFSILIKGADQTIVAGVAGWTWASACEITNLWVSENERNKRLGKRLLETAEAEAKKRGCRQILVRSYSFQAPHFYEKYGFEIEHVITGFPEGHDYYFLIKRLR